MESLHSASVTLSTVQAKPAPEREAVSQTSQRSWLGRRVATVRQIGGSHGVTCCCVKVAPYLRVEVGNTEKKTARGARAYPRRRMNGACMGSCELPRSPTSRRLVRSVQGGEGHTLLLLTNNYSNISHS